MPALGPRFRDALAYAAEVHADQRRKGNDVPYVAHLLAVASTVIEAGGSEDQAVAALLHDTLEDHPDKVNRAGLSARFGEEVARIVVACSDTEVEPKPPWHERKQAYLARLPHEDDAVLLVSLADKLHNATALRRDLEREGPATLHRFHAGAEDQLWYHRSLAAVFTERLTEEPVAGLVREYVVTVDRIAALVTP